MPNDPKVSRRKVSDLTPDPQNANLGTERGLRILDDSIAEAGLGRSVVVDKNGVLIAGNKTAERALDRGIDDAIVVHTDGQQLVVVQRDDLDLTANGGNNPARKMAFYDNRAGEVGLAWDAAQIAASVEAGLDMSSMFHEWEIDTIAGRALDEFDPAALWQGMPEFEQGDKTAFHSVQFHFYSPSAMQEFAALIGQTITEKTKFINIPPSNRDNPFQVVDES